MKKLTNEQIRTILNEIDLDNAKTEVMQHYNQFYIVIQGYTEKDLINGDVNQMKEICGDSCRC